MKPPTFRYLRPESVTETLSILTTEEDAKILAGGQSLVPAMNFRLARPSVLIDINHLSELDLLEVEDGRLRIGALVRHSRLEDPVIDDPLGDLLTSASHYVGHYPIRVRGTFGGSISHADPAAEWCLIARTVDAELVAASERGTRTIAASDFFQTVFTTDLAEDELLTEVRMPVLGEHARVGFSEFSRRAGDFALVAVAVVLDVEDEIVRSARIGVAGLGGRPERAEEAASLLTGRSSSREAFEEAANVASQELNPSGDIHGSPEYRRNLIRVLTKRALEQTLGGEQPQ
ncbi:MAG: FAD binding domain-containing protein [Actinomycetota bacterium]